MSSDLQTLVLQYQDCPTNALRSSIVTNADFYLSLLSRTHWTPEARAYTPEDLESEATLKLLELLDEYDPACGLSFAAYAAEGIGSHLGRFTTAMQPVYIEAPLREPAADPDYMLDYERVRPFILGHLKQLPLRSQLAFHLYYLAGLSARELGQVLQVPSQTARLIAEETMADVRQWLCLAGYARPGADDIVRIAA